MPLKTSGKLNALCRPLIFSVLVSSILACSQTRASPGAQDTWLSYGTRGATGLPHAQGEAQCAASDVKIDDLDRAPVTAAPSGNWPSTPVQAPTSFCGNRD